MVDATQTRPKWAILSHHARYRRLTKVRRVWGGRCYSESTDYQGRTVYLDGTWINDVPSFYLTLGEAVNGPNGYFGAGLDALADCLCGNFGVLPPLTIRLSHFDEVRKALDGRAWCRFHAEHFYAAVKEGEATQVLIDAGYLGDGSENDIARWTAIYRAALTSGTLDYGEYNSYFDALLEVLKRSGAELLPD